MANEEVVDDLTFPTESFINMEEEESRLKNQLAEEKEKIQWLIKETQNRVLYEEEKRKRIEELKRELKEIEEEIKLELARIEKQKEILDKKFEIVANRLQNKFKGWLITEEDTGGMDGDVWWYEWKLYNPKTGEKAIVFISLSYDPYKKEYYGTVRYEIRDKKGKLKEIEEEYLEPL